MVGENFQIYGALINGKFTCESKKKKKKKNLHF